jgi:hypothetical protein
MNKLFFIFLLLTSFNLHSQCDSLQNQLEIEHKTTLDFLSEKLFESDVQIDKLKCQLQTARVEIMKQKTLKWIAIIGGGYISSMTFLMYVKK